MAVFVVVFAMTASFSLVHAAVAATVAVVVLGLVIITLTAVGSSLVFKARAAHLRRALDQLLLEARVLDQPMGPTVGGPAWDEAREVSVAMRLSSLRMHQRLRQEKAFSSNTAHQLRTPLAGLRLQLEELATAGQTPRHLRAQLQAPIQEIDRLTAIIADLLTLAHSATLPRAQHPTDLAVVAVHARRRWASAASAAGRDLNVKGPLVPSPVPAASAPISQVLDVLIDNALKHGDGEVGIAVDVVGTRARLRVSDQGANTFPDAASPLRHPRAKGEGIGLALAEELAEALGGQLAAAPHTGTAFDLFLPLATATPARPARIAA